MNKEVRIQKIQEIIDRNDPFGKMEIPWEDQLKSMEVYKIPLDYLVYNKYNGRILSRTKSLEKQNQLLDPESLEGKRIIEELLYNSNPERNSRTLKNITDFGQLKVGIITKDGIIIDGNRRAMLLNKIDKYDYFKAVVLPVTLDENQLGIEKLETSYQMGEDEKLGYNATEKYIKAKEIYIKLTGKSEIDIKKFNESAIKKISDWMGETEGEIKKYLETITIMDEYLMYFDYDGIYTQLDDREDQFLFLNKWLKNYYGEDSARAFDGYTDSDVDDLKVIAFDYLRIRRQYDGKRFRLLADGNRDKHIFGERTIWNSFRSKHFDVIRNLPPEAEIDFNSKNIEAHLNNRDNKFFESANTEKDGNAFIENLNDHEYQIGYNKAADEPEKLVKRAAQTFDAIKTNHKAFSQDQVQDQVLDLGQKVFASLQKKSPLRVLDHIVNLLENIDVENIPESELDKIEKRLKRIQQLGYSINKQL